MNSKKIVVLGTGGTIAGTAATPQDNLGYTAGQLGVDELLRRCAIGPDAGLELLTEQLAQVDSKDMGFAIWRQLALRCAYWLAQSDVHGVVVTHGTDTIEETAYFLHAVLPTQSTLHKAVVLTCAMRPASSAFADGPANLHDALVLVSDASARGVLAVCAARVHSACAVQKVHPYRLDALDSGEAGPVAVVEADRVRWLTPPQASLGSQDSLWLCERLTQLPPVEIVMSHADSGGAVVDALVQCGGPAQPRGLVLAATGNGSLHQGLAAAAQRAHRAGIEMVIATRCAYGQVLDSVQAQWPHSAGLSPVKARIALALALARKDDASHRLN